MYDSRSSHARRPQHHAALMTFLCRKDQRRDDLYFGRGRLKGRDVLTHAEAIAEGLLEMEPEVEDQPVFSRSHLNRLHAEALLMDILEMDRIEREAWDWLDLFDEQGEDIDEDDDEGYPEPWMRALTMTEAREHFGPDFEHNGFHIINTAPRRATTMSDTATQRLQATLAAQAQRERTERLAAQIDPDRQARVMRPLPVPNAERREPTPYERYAGVYNEALDPISPDFAIGSWGGE